MPRLLRFAAAAVAAALFTAPSTVAAQSTFADFDAFVAAIGPSGIDTFDDLGLDLLPGPLARSAGAYSYSVASTAGVPFDNLFPIENPASAGDLWLSLEDGLGSLSFSGFGSEVFAIGGRFFATDFGGAVSGTSLRVQASDVMGNSIDEVLSPATADAFFGVRFDYAVASLTLSAENGQGPDFFFATANDLVLGEGARAVPEPHAAWLLVAGLGALLVVRRRTA
jgi:hypothetical protein